MLKQVLTLCSLNYNCEMQHSVPNYSCELQYSVPNYSCELQYSVPNYNCELQYSVPNYSCELQYSIPNYNCELQQCTKFISQEISNLRSSKQPLDGVSLIKPNAERCTINCSLQLDIGPGTSENAVVFNLLATDFIFKFKHTLYSKCE